MGTGQVSCTAWMETQGQVPTLGPELEVRQGGEKSRVWPQGPLWSKPHPVLLPVGYTIHRPSSQGCPPRPSMQDVFLCLE